MSPSPLARRSPSRTARNPSSVSRSCPGSTSASTSSRPEACVILISPDLRFFVRNTGSAGPLLRVDLNYTNLLGKQATATIGLLAGDEKWTPTLPLLFLLNTLPQAGLQGQTWVSFTLTPMGQSGNCR